MFDNRTTVIKTLTIVLMIFFSSLFFKSNAQELVVKTNMPYLLTTTPNIGVEYAFARNFSFELTAGLGMARFEYDSYSLSGEGFQVGQGKKNYFGPTKGAVSIVYTIR